MQPSLIHVRVTSFGPLRSSFSAGGEPYEMPLGSTVGQLVGKLLQEGRVPETTMQCAAIAVQQEYASHDTLLQDGDEVAILPPVSGGSDATSAGIIELVNTPIDVAAIQQSMKAGGDGALCVFDGIVRDNTRGRGTLHLDYEAYEAMALRQMQRLRSDAITQYGVREVAIVHRLGRLTVGETSVLIVVASAHRGAAFDACRWVIDTLKKTVPIWKKEQFVDGAVWADGEPFPPDLNSGRQPPTGSAKAASEKPASVKAASEKVASEKVEG